MAGPEQLVIPTVLPWDTCNEAVFLCVQPMGYGPRMQQPSSQSQFLPQTPFSTQGLNVTNMPLAPTGGQAPVSQVCLTNGFSSHF